MTDKDYARRCLERANASGRYTWVSDDGYIVASDSEPGVARRVTFKPIGSAIRFTCTCPAGHFHSRESVPCKHAALVGKRLVRDGLAVADGGRFTVPPEQQDLRVQVTQEQADAMFKKFASEDANDPSKGVPL